jgi:hypothetical protein
MGEQGGSERNDADDRSCGAKEFLLDLGQDGTMPEIL